MLFAVVHQEHDIASGVKERALYVFSIGLMMCTTWLLVYVEPTPALRCVHAKYGPPEAH